MSLNQNQTYYNNRNSEYINKLKSCIEKNYNINIIDIKLAKRGYMAETYTVIGSKEKFFAKIVSLGFHKNTYRESFKVVDFLNQKNIDFILKNIKTIDNQLTCNFENNVLGLFKFIEGEHSEDYPLRLLFEKYSLIYQINVSGPDIKKENFNADIIELFESVVSKVENKENYEEIVEFLNSKKEILESYKKKLMEIGNQCKNDLNDFHITHGDGQGNVIVNGNNITIVDWDTPLFSPIERDAWVFLDKQETLEEFNKVLDENGIKYKLRKERLSYYCYFYFFYYLVSYLEIIINTEDDIEIKKLFNELKDFFSPSNWLYKKMNINIMLEKDIPDYNIFMICEKLNKSAFREELPKGYHIRNCKKSEFNVWKKFPFDNDEQAKEYDEFMQNYFDKTYEEKQDLFYSQCKFICDENDNPITTGFIWKHYDKYTTVNWLKTLKKEEGKGLGRILLTHILKDVDSKDYPIYLHTQPGSFKAIKLYSDFGFKLMKSPKIIDKRNNELEESLPILKEFMPKEDYDNLKFYNKN